MKLHHNLISLTLGGLAMMLSLAPHNRVVPTWLSLPTIILWGAVSVIAIIKAKKITDSQDETQQK